MTITPLSQQRQESLLATKAWSPSCPVPLDRLRSVHVSYLNFQGQLRHDGELIVLDAVAQATQRIFWELLDRRFPIHSIQPIDVFNADDDASVDANNTSAHCYRLIANTTTPSVHGYGVAIDINPLQNPYVAPIRNPGGMVTLADHKIDYLNRRCDVPGMVEPIVDIFYKNGFFVWGGLWRDCLDLHHFQTTRAMGRIMTTLTPEQAQQFFDVCCSFPHMATLLTWPEQGACDALTQELLSHAQKNPETASWRAYLASTFSAKAAEIGAADSQSVAPGPHVPPIFVD